MSNSTFAKKYIPAPSTNHWGARNEKIKKIIVHHAGGIISAEALANLFANPERKASATYVIGNDGTIIRCLDENVTPGTSGGYEYDKDAVTIEVSDGMNAAPWTVSAKALKSLIMLCADIAKRNGLGNLVKGNNLCWHSMYQATACPGEYLLSKMNYIASEANKLNTPKVEAGVITGINTSRPNHALIMYTQGKTGTNKWGTEVAVDKDFNVLSVEYGKGNMTVPVGGFVLSGIDENDRFLLENAKVGEKLKLKVGV
jgi:hypothetical protein